MTTFNMTCDEFDAALPDYLEGTLNASAQESVEGHLNECVRCASLLRDIENIRKEAAALPDLTPSRDLWQGIEARIAAPVIPLAARPERRRRLVSAWMGVAAAALVVSTAGITYMLTARSFQGGSTTVATANPGGPPIQAQPDTDTGAAQLSTGANPADTGPTNAGEARRTPRPSQSGPAIRGR